MPNLDELEHDSNEDAVKPLKGTAVVDPPEDPIVVRKQLAGRTGQEPWLDENNPAIWTGEVDE